MFNESIMTTNERICSVKATVIKVIFFVDDEVWNAGYEKVDAWGLWGCAAVVNCGSETKIEDRPSFHRFMQDGSRMSSLTLW
jgi:hypothetical protein